MNPTAKMLAANSLFSAARASGTGAESLPIADAEFAALIAVLAPFGAAPALAVAASGGADSTALALLAARWAAERRGTVLALVADHGLRPESAAEAALTLGRLAGRGIAARLLHLDLKRGAALAERAREARYAALIQACREVGIAHLLLGHHVSDQAETVLMRRLSGSAAAGLAGMAPIRELADVRLLRPLLGVPPGRLRATCRAHAMEWVEDPSNRDPAGLRARLRAQPDRPQQDSAVLAAAAASASARVGQDAEVATILAERAAIYPAGFAVLSPGPVPPAALALLLQTISGNRYAPSLRQVAPLAADPRPATLGGTRIMRAGRLGPGFLIVREEAAQSPSVPAEPGALWDGRFRLGLGTTPPPGARLGALGAATGLRARSALPSAVLRVSPAIWLGEVLLAAPHLDHPDPLVWRDLPVWFTPRQTAAGAPWPAAAECGAAIAAPFAKQG